MTRTTTKHTIVIESASKQGVIRREAVGTALINPGHLIEFKSGGKIGVHALAGAPAAQFFALESPTPDTIQHTTTATKDIAYDSGETIYYAQGAPGDVFDAWIPSGDSVVKGRNFLVSDASGKLTDIGTGNAGVGTGNPVAMAWETVNASGGTAVRCKVLIL